MEIILKLKFASQTPARFEIEAVYQLCDYSLSKISSFGFYLEFSFFLYTGVQAPFIQSTEGSAFTSPSCPSSLKALRRVSISNSLLKASASKLGPRLPRGPLGCGPLRRKW